jgi:hypothetical protein
MFKSLISLFMLAVVLAQSTYAEERVTVVQERDPFLGAPLPQNVVYETKNGWKFKDDTLVFFSENRNPDGRRYIIWKDYHWIITETEFTVLDPRPFGTSITASRRGTDKKGRQLSDNQIMDDLKDQAGDLRRAREPIAPPPPVSIGIGWGFGFGPRYHGHGHGHRHRHR